MSIFDTLGSTISLETDDSPLTYTPIGLVSSINGVGWTRNNVEVTTLASAAREFRQTIKDGGTITLGIQYDPALTSQTDVRDLTNTNHNFQVELNDGSPGEKWTFAAGVQSFMLGDITVDGIQTATITLKVSGNYAVT